MRGREIVGMKGGQQRETGERVRAMGDSQAQNWGVAERGRQQVRRRGPDSSQEAEAGVTPRSCQPVRQRTDSY